MLKENKRQPVEGGHRKRSEFETRTLEVKEAVSFIWNMRQFLYFDNPHGGPSRRLVTWRRLGGGLISVTAPKAAWSHWHSPIKALEN